ncbi:MAG TPA: ABC transporter family substrate-binding protein [Homoserinimonas sp.]|nr:ABC transporter family substrate-binding protein [Homoserinimonas sp.]
MVVAVATMLALAGCTPASEVVEGTSVTVAIGQALTSYNPNTRFGSATAANASVFAATNSSFASYDDVPALTRDDSFGSYEVVSTQPLVVTYTVRDGIRWSDGTPIDAADLLLAWAANSTSLNDPEFDPTEFIDEGTGNFTAEFPKDVVYFDGFTGNGLQLVTQTPVIGEDGRSITMTFDEYFADWELVFDIGLPAHVVAGQALRIADPQEAKDALLAAVEDADHRDLAAISRFWNSGFNLGDDGIDSDLLVGSGPYLVSAITPGEQVTLTANPQYRGEHLPHFEEVVVRFISDPLQAVAALESGEVDIIAPQATEDVLGALDGQEGAEVEHGFSGTWERLDLQVTDSKNGFVENELVRRAFLHTVPRQEILNSLIHSISPDAEPRDSHVFLPGAKGYTASLEENGSQNFAEVDIDEAKRLLAEAAKVSPGLATPTVCLLFDPANPRRVAEFQLIQDSAAPAGIAVTNCSSPDWRNLLGTPRSYDAALYGLRETNLAMSAVEASFAGDSELNNNAGYANPAADALLAEARGPVSASERRELLIELDALLWADAVGMPLYQFPTITVTSDQVTGVIHSPFARTALWNPWRWEPVATD